MKTFLMTLVLAVGLLFNTSAQTAQQDLSITGNYHINIVYPKGQMTVSGIITNNSQSDYKDIVYQIQCLAVDGTVMETDNYEWYNFIGHGTTKKLTEMTYKCPQGCKTITLSIVGGTRLVSQ